MRYRDNNRRSNHLFCMNDKGYIQKFLIALLGTLNVLFLAYYVALSCNYSMHFDDVHFMWKLRDFSIREFVYDMYMTRGGNWVGYGITGILFKSANWIGDYHWIPIVLYIAGVLMTLGAVRGLFKGVSKWGICMSVIAIYNIYMLTAPDFAVTTWLCACNYYLFATCMCLLIRYLNYPKLEWWRWLILVYLVLNLGGCNVVVTPMALLLMLAMALIIWQRNSWQIVPTWADVRIRRIVYVTIAILVVFGIMMVAPGNYARLETGDDMNHPTSLMEFGIAYVKCVATYIYMMAFYIPYYLLVLALGCYVGINSLNNWVKDKKKALLEAVGAYAAYLAVSVLPLAYLSGGFGIQRNYTHATFFLVMLFFAIGYIMGEGKTQWKKQVGVACGVLAVGMCAIVVLNVRQDIPVIRNYRIAHEQRFEYLKQLQEQGNTETVYVDPYPSVCTPDVKYNVMKMLRKNTSMQAINYPADTDVEPNEYEGHIRKLLKLDFDFVLAEPKE